LILVRPIVPRFPTIIGRLLKTFPSVFASGTKFSSFSQSTTVTESALIAESTPVTEPTTVTESATVTDSASVTEPTAITDSAPVVESAERHTGTYPTDSRKAQVSIVRWQLAWTLPRGQVRSAVPARLGIEIQEISYVPVAWTVPGALPIRETLSLANTSRRSLADPAARRTIGSAGPATVCPRG
jgi:hypothetical protein